MTKTLVYKFGSPDFPDRFEKYSDGSIVDTENEVPHDKTRAALDALAKLIGAALFSAKDAHEYQMAHKFNETIRHALTEAAELKAQNEELLEALKRIEWGKYKTFEWATSEQLRDMAREAIARAEKGQ